jgi:hypothetical protein
MFDSIFGWVNKPLSNGDSTAVDSALKTYYRARIANDLLHKASDRFMPDKTQALQQQQATLDIALKRAQLGYPMDSDDLEEALGGGSKGLPVGGLALAGLGAGLSAVARPGAGSAAALFMRGLRPARAKLPLWPGATVANLTDAGATGITRIMGRVFQFPKP